ncbi:Zn2/Cys6 DNA-binding protein [Glarea lozoyensis ATCC 20868]|uniref:Zn2/Cys6 DNA-binding protein n=1 Tax=Glarea lozoyensis (strain ATCC 20868 / MF5171) TaxID=1116229 RepID=S3CLW6_GLAL2|nr:Zn2/Cys6 DNA-binding protein [Glarea lozoyensis ATCC 20868]EPE27497.1 Zn2/Cys6 DNA-binding protein [Glarea lozoyensis ATCC 20868]
MSGSRTKSGCYTCRIRKKKCDEEKPCCLNCRSREIHCDGYGEKPQWMHGMGSWKEIMDSKNAKLIRESAEATYKSRRRGRNMKIKKAMLVMESSNSQEVQYGTASGFELPENEKQMNPNTEASSTSDLPHYSFEPSNLCTQDDHGIEGCALELWDPGFMDGLWWDSSLVSTYPSLGSSLGLLITFLDVIFPLQYGFYGVSGTRDKTWLLRFMNETKPLHQATLSLAITFGTGKGNARRCGVTSIISDATRLQTKAINGLRRNVEELSTNESESEFLRRKGIQTLATMIQLLSLEIFSLVEGQWEMHLQAARTVFGIFHKQWITLLINDPKSCLTTEYTNDLELEVFPRDDRQMLNFFVTSFVWIDIIANATFGTPNQKPRQVNYIPLLQNNQLKLHEMMGCQTWVMLAIAEITALKSWKESQMTAGTLSVVQLVEHAAKFDKKIKIGIDDIKRKPSQKRESLEADSELVTLCFAYSALVYLHTIVSGTSPLAPEIQENTKRCLELLGSMPTRLLIRVCLPFTIAGCMATEDQPIFGECHNDQVQSNDPDPCLFPHACYDDFCCPGPARFENELPERGPDTGSDERLDHWGGESQVPWMEPGEEEEMFSWAELPSISGLKVPEDDFLQISSDSPESNAYTMSSSHACVPSQTPSDEPSQQLKERPAITNGQNSVSLQNFWTCDAAGCLRSFPQRYMLK